MPADLANGAKAAQLHVDLIRATHPSGRNTNEQCQRCFASNGSGSQTSIQGAKFFAASFPAYHFQTPSVVLDSSPSRPCTEDYCIVKKLRCCR